MYGRFPSTHFYIFCHTFVHIRSVQNSKMKIVKRKNFVAFAIYYPLVLTKRDKIGGKS